MGTPLVIDNLTLKHLFGHYARILGDIDFSRKLIYEIVVEREGFAFTVVVAYEWLPDFCSHCQNIGHDVTVCRRLYPRQETTPKERIDKGKKQVPITKATWVTTKDNLSGIGSSLAFGATNNSIPEPVRVVEEIETEAQQNKAAHVQRTEEAELVQSAPHHVIASQNQEEETIDRTDAVLVETQEDEIHERTDDIPAALPTPLEVEEDNAAIPVVDDINEHHDIDINATINVEADTEQQEDTISPSPDITVNSFSMPLVNVTDEVVRNDLTYHGPILSTVQNLDVSSIAADPNTTVHPTLRKEMDFMKTWLKQAVVNEEVPFSPVKSKAQKKKLNKLNKAADYQTRSQGPPPSSQ